MKQSAKQSHQVVKKNWTSFISSRYFRSRKKDKFVNLTSKIATFSISFGIAMLILAFSVIRGFEESIFDKVLEDQGHIVVFGNGNFNPHEVKAYMPNSLYYKESVETYGMFTNGFRVEMAMIKGVEKKEIDKVKTKNSLIEETKHPKAYIGNKFAKLFGLNIGDNLKFIIPVKAPMPFGLVPETVECTVADIVQFSTHDLNRYGVFIEISDAKSLLKVGNNVTKITAYLKDKTKLNQAPQIAQEMQSNLINYRIFSWQDLNMIFADIMRIQRNMVTVILFAIIILAITASIASLALFINTKKREISILLILGASRKNIRGIFIKLAAMISITSSIIGTVFGLVLTYYIDDIRRFIEYIFNKPIFDPSIYLLPAIPTSIHWQDIAVIVGTSFIITIIAAISPAHKSTQINVLENLS